MIQGLAFIFNRRVSSNVRIGPFLDSFYGIGSRISMIFCIRLGVGYRTLLRDVPSYLTIHLNEILSKFYTPEFEFRRQVADNISFKLKLGNYSAVRISQGLGARGQRSKTNAKTPKRRLILKFSKQFATN